jgi:hypothetical protein
MDTYSRLAAALGLQLTLARPGAARRPHMGGIAI